MKKPKKSAAKPWPDNKRLLLALDGAHLGLWDGDIATGKVSWNDQCYRLFGLPAGEPMTHERFLSLLVPEDREGVARVFQEAMRGQADFQVDYQTTWPDGSRHWIRTLAGVHHGTDGQPIRVSGVTMDITREKQAVREIQALNEGLAMRIQARTAEREAKNTGRCRLEEEQCSLTANLKRKVKEGTAQILTTQGTLRDRGRRFCTIFNTVRDGILIQDPDSGEVIDVNDRLAEQYGGSREEVLAAGFGALLSDEPPYTLADAQEKMRRLRSEGPQTFEWLGRRRDGSTFWMEISLNLSLIKGATRILALTHDISARKAAEQALRESEERYRTIVNNVADSIYVIDLAGNFLAVNDHACRRYGYSREEFLQRQVTAINTPEEAVTVPARLAAVERDGQVAFEAHHQDAQGRPLEVEVRASKILFNGRPAMLSVVRDLTERRRAEAQLRENEERFRRLFHETRQPLSLIEDGYFVAINKATLAMLRLDRPEQLLGHSPGEVSPPYQPDGRASAEKAAEMMRIAYEQGAHEFEWEHVRADGERFPAIILLTAISERNKTLLHVVWNDITAQKRAQERAGYLAYYDALTGLPNRVLGLDHLAKHVAQARRYQCHLAVLYLDLDQFKHINDTYGHFLGDKLLQDAGGRLSRELRAEDTLCRLAADEFMLVLPEVVKDRALADLTSLCDRLLALFAEPFDLEGRQVYVGLSLGVALYPRDGTDGETLMRHADTALYAAKRAGRQTWRFFEPSMNDELRRFVHTRDALRAALERQEFVLHYQPQIELPSGQVVGVEALLRWQRPGEGLVKPAAFLDVAEESGLIVPLGGWVLREACRQAAAWRAAGWPDLVVAVNLSAIQFRRGQIGAEVLEALEESGLDPAGLELELTESLLLHGEAAVEDTLTQWKARGIQLSIDDFGTGYSSLTYLKRFQVDKIKIDRSFIAEMAENDQDLAIVQAIIDMAGALKLRTVAEGVEDAKLASQLRLLGCDEAQGYLYAPPLAVRDLERWLSEPRQA